MEGRLFPPEIGFGTMIERSGQSSRLVRSLRGDTGDGGAPVAEQIQRGAVIERLPDVYCQPESAIPISLAIPATLCPLGFTGSTTWTNVLTYVIGHRRKLILVDAWIAFTNPYVAQIASGRFIDDMDSPLGFPVRLQKVCCANPRNRLSIAGGRTLYMQLKRDVNTDAWEYGTFFGQIVGWDVPDMFSNDERMYK